MGSSVNSDPEIVQDQTWLAGDHVIAPDMMHWDIMCIVCFCKDTNIRSIDCMDLNAKGVCVEADYIHDGVERSSTGQLRHARASTRIRLYSCSNHVLSQRALSMANHQPRHMVGRSPALFRTSLRKPRSELYLPRWNCNYTPLSTPIASVH